MSRPWMPLYVSDYLADTGHLSTVEHGAYMLLIMHYWQTGRLPTTDPHLARICRMSEAEWSGIRNTIAALFGSDWRHARIDAEMAKAEHVISNRSAAGKAGASARYGKRKREPQQVNKQTNSHLPTPSIGSSSEPSVLETSDANSKSEEGMKIAVSPADPVLNGSLPEWREHYSVPIIAELQFKFESQAIEALLPDLWDWAGKIAAAPNERMKLIYKTLENKHKAATEGPALTAEKPVAAAVSPQLAASRLARAARPKLPEPDLPAFLDRRKAG